MIRKHRGQMNFNDHAPVSPCLQSSRKSKKKTPAQNTKDEHARTHLLKGLPLLRRGKELNRPVSRDLEGARPSHRAAAACARVETQGRGRIRFHARRPTGARPCPQSREERVGGGVVAVGVGDAGAAGSGAAARAAAPGVAGETFVREARGRSYRGGRGGHSAHGAGAVVVVVVMVMVLDQLGGAAAGSAAAGAADAAGRALPGLLSEGGGARGG